ncbi:40059_t:CDS:2, partial [Gigaspora margarita]
DVIPDDVSSYRIREYWNQRYSKEPSNTTFDWFKTYKDLKPSFDEHLQNKDVSILMLGCGNSTLSEDMYDAGYHNITNVDFSAIVIENMQTRCIDKVGMSWLVMDIRDLKFPEETFDVIIDKGTMDALMSDEGNVWDPKPETVENVKRAVDQVVRVLKIGGKVNIQQFIYITFGQPHFRRKYLERPCWDIDFKKL